MLWIGRRRGRGMRTGADAWMRHGLAALGLTDHWFPPLCLALALLAWQAVDRPRVAVLPVLAGDGDRELVLAVALVGLSRLVDLGFENLERAAWS